MLSPSIGAGYASGAAASRLPWLLPSCISSERSTHSDEAERLRRVLVRAVRRVTVHQSGLWGGEGHQAARRGCCCAPVCRPCVCRAGGAGCPAVASSASDCRNLPKIAGLEGVIVLRWSAVRSAAHSRASLWPFSANTDFLSLSFCRGLLSPTPFYMLASALKRPP